MSLFNSGDTHITELFIDSDDKQIVVGEDENVTLSINTDNQRDILFPDSIDNEIVSYRSYVDAAENSAISSALSEAAEIFLKLDGTNEMVGNINFVNNGYITSLGSGILESNVSFILPPNQDDVSLEPNNIYLSLDTLSDGITRWKSIPTANTSGQKGLTILSNNTTSDSEEYAATSLAVKNAFDIICRIGC